MPISIEFNLKSTDVEEHAARNQLSYNHFWEDHSKLSLYHSTKFLAHRDLFALIDKYLLQPASNTKYKMMDYGCGAGETAQVVHDLFIACGKEVELYCVDKNQNNLDVTKQKIPHANLFLVGMNSFPENIAGVDLIICNFVLLENTYPDMLVILENIRNALSDTGIAIVTHNTAKVYDSQNTWVSFNTNFAENQRDFYDAEKKKHTRSDGKAVMKSILDAKGNTLFKFHDFFYRRSTYKNAFATAKLELLDSHKPLGKPDDPVAWKSEAQVAPYRIDVLRRAPAPALDLSSSDSQRPKY